MKITKLLAGAAAGLVAVALAGCGDDGGEGDTGGPLTVWSLW
jgi:hypothetical protein